jgi:hypothetical protein
MTDSSIDEDAVSHSGRQRDGKTDGIQPLRLD